jgi:hypothetical protein
MRIKNKTYKKLKYKGGTQLSQNNPEIKIDTLTELIALFNEIDNLSDTPSDIEKNKIIELLMKDNMNQLIKEITQILTVLLNKKKNEERNIIPNIIKIADHIELVAYETSKAKNSSKTVDISLLENIRNLFNKISKLNKSTNKTSDKFTEQKNSIINDLSKTNIKKIIKKITPTLEKIVEKKQNGIRGLQKINEILRHIRGVVFVSSPIPVTPTGKGNVTRSKLRRLHHMGSTNPSTTKRKNGEGLTKEKLAALNKSSNTNNRRAQYAKSKRPISNEESRSGSGTSGSVSGSGSGSGSGFGSGSGSGSVSGSGSFGSNGSGSSGSSGPVSLTSSIFGRFFPGRSSGATKPPPPPNPPPKPPPKLSAKPSGTPLNGKKPVNQNTIDPKI